ncbi:unnamed protein product [marine sediment metagenome]|uniref:Uncharacterized protein n=1 Tax=marine sediment metagenome TaxID=412755 RepID=X0WSL2_9ZZZZ
MSFWVCPKCNKHYKMEHCADCNYPELPDMSIFMEAVKDSETFLSKE